MKWTNPISIPESILKLDLSPTALRLWLALVKFTDKDLVCWPSNRRLLSMLPAGLTERSLRYAKRELLKTGLLVTNDRFDEDGRQTSSLYELHTPQEETFREGEKISGDEEETGFPHEAEGGFPPGTYSIGTQEQKELKTFAANGKFPPLAAVSRGKDAFVVDPSLVTQWQETYPAVNVSQKLRALWQWDQANPKRRKINLRRWIVNCLSRDQDNAARVNPLAATSDEPPDLSPELARIWEKS